MKGDKEFHRKAHAWRKLDYCRGGFLNDCKPCIENMTVDRECLGFSFLTKKGRDFLFRTDLKQEVSRYE